VSAELAYGWRVRHRRRYRLRRKLTEAAALGLGVVIVIWTLTPIYNMVAVALESHGDVFTNDIWPAKPSLESFWIVVTQGYWYLEYFWQQFGNSLYDPASHGEARRNRHRDKGGYHRPCRLAGRAPSDAAQRSLACW
jgi:hypothetical protein